MDEIPRSAIKNQWLISSLNDTETDDVTIMVENETINQEITYIPPRAQVCGIDPNNEIRKIVADDTNNIF